MFNCSLSIASWSVLTGALSKGLGLRLSRSPRSNPAHFEYRRRHSEGGAIARIVTTFSPGQAGLLHLTVQQPLGKEMNRLISNKYSFYSFGIEASCWFRCGEARKPQCPQTFPFVGSPPKLHPLPAATPHGGKEGLKSISLRPAQLALPKTSCCFFFFFYPSLAEPVSSEIQSHRKRSRRRDKVVEMVCGYEG